MASSGTTEPELIEALERTLRNKLPRTWDLVVVLEPDRGLDALIEIVAPDGAIARVAVEYKRVVEPRDVASVVAQIQRSGTATGLLVTPFVSPRTREGLAGAGLGWFDATGNLRLRVDRPALFVESVGADRNPFSDSSDRRLKSLRGQGAARTVRALCETDLPVGVRALAARAEVGVATSARVLELLERADVIVRGSREEVVDVRKQSLLRRWTADYGLMTSNDVIPMLDPRGLRHTLDALRSGAGDYAATGSAAARAYLPDDLVPVTPLTTVTVHTRRITELARTIGLRPVDRGANVFVVRPFDEFVLRGVRLVNDLSCVAPAQAVADLLTGPGRSTEEADQLMRVLADDDPRWAA